MNNLLAQVLDTRIDFAKAKIPVHTVFKARNTSFGYMENSTVNKLGFKLQTDNPGAWTLNIPYSSHMIKIPDIFQSGDIKYI